VKTNPTPESRGVRLKAAENGALADSAGSSPNCSKARQNGPTTFSRMSAVSVAEADIWRTAKAIKQAGCRDVLIIYTSEFVRFIVTTKLPKSR
jgi:hypothetical protein